MSMSDAASQETEPFPSALFAKEWPTATHLIELAMRDLSYAIRSKPSWWTKCQDPVVRSKWIAEAKAQPVRGFTLDDAHIEYVLDELEAYAEARSDNGIQPGLQRGFWEAENLVSGDLKNLLSRELAELRDVPEEEKDWHPGSDRQVLDLVHPSMYCVRYGKTALVGGPIAQAPAMRDHPDYTRLEGVGESWSTVPAAQRSGHSTSTSWIPTDVVVAEHGGDISLKGYVNNVHPIEQQRLQEGLRQLLASFVPMFERLLGDLRRYSVATVLGDLQSELDEKNQPINPKTGDPINFWPDEDEEDAYDENPAWREWLDTCPYIDPKPEKYIPEGRVLGTGYSLNGKTIQVIAKVAEIHLTPDRPHYEGGGWHVEGMLNESIVATGIHYLTSENITKSKLSFRMGLDTNSTMELPYEQEDPGEVLKRSYGLTRDSPLNQYLGSFEAAEGRSIAFPNLYQHKVEPFSLADPTKPGRRTIIAFFLCDPTYKVLSTSDVAPQKADWLRCELHNNCKTSRLHKLAPELKDQLVDQLVRDEVLLERHLAEAVREELMNERSKFQTSQNQDVFEAEFSLCEH